MFHSSARFVLVSAIASFVAFAASPAHACSDIATAASSLIAGGSTTQGGAAFFGQTQRTAFGFVDQDMRDLWDGSIGPGSPYYYQRITSGEDFTTSHFTQITAVASLAAGDALVINSSSTYTGHTMIVMGAATQLVPTLNPKYSGTTQWVVPIADSTTAVHGCNAAYPDSRVKAGFTCGTANSFTAGPGTAYIRVYADLAGGLLGYTWSVTSSTSSYFSPATRPYAVGRLTPCPPEPALPPPPV